LEDIENDERFKYIEFFHTPQKIVLKEQYISIQVTLDAKRKDVESFWGYVESGTELKRAYALKGMGEESQRNQLDWKDARKQHQRLIVLADPGMGKSTLLKMEAGTTAQSEKQKLLDNEITVDEVVFPLFLRLSDLIDEKVEGIFKAEIIDIIPVLIQRDYPKTATTIQLLLKEKLEKGKCVLLLDALDEVPGEHRNRLKDKLNRFAGNYPCPIICTSRIVGYGGALVKGAKEVEIVPFSQKQTEEYIEIWFENAAGYIDDSVSAKGLIQELRNKPQIGGLAQNPLLLSLLCSLHQEKGLTLPARRTQVYEKAVDCMLQKWSQNRKPQSEGKIRAKVRLLEELAYHFSCEGKEIFSSDELYDWIEEYLQGEKVPTVFRKTDTGELIAELSEEDGILQKLAREGDRYLFLHRTFQEYLTASYLNRASDSIALAREHFWEYEWHETLSLLAGLMENPVSLLQAITAEKDDIFSTLLLLAGQCIAESQENSHPLITKIIDRIYELWQSRPFAPFSQSVVVTLGQVNSQMFQRLQEALNDSHSIVRRETVWTLYEIDKPQAVDALISALNHSDRYVRRDTALALGMMGDPQAVDALIDTFLNDSDSEHRSEAALVLAKMGNPQAVDALIDAFLNNSNLYIRRQAAEALAEIGNSQAVDALFNTLNNSNDLLEILTALTLDRISNPQAVDALIDALNGTGDAVRWHAALALGRIGNPQAVNALTNVLNGADEAVRWHAALALCRIPNNRQVVDALINVLNDSNVLVRKEAALALGKMGNPKAVDTLINILNGAVDSNRSQAAKALGKIGNSQAVNALIAALNCSSWEIREAAAGALAKIGYPQAADVLIDALNHSDDSVRWQAALILAEIGNPEAVEVLIDALNHSSWFIRWQAARTLGEVGNPQAMNALINALKNSDWHVREQAAKALGEICTPETLANLIQLPEINIYDPDIFPLAKKLAVRFSKERLPFIPVYPELVAHKQ
jgi:HEAT repeat protein